jgi:hypothetical protein
MNHFVSSGRVRDLPQEDMQTCFPSRLRALTIDSLPMALAFAKWMGPMSARGAWATDASRPLNLLSLTLTGHGG